MAELFYRRLFSVVDDYGRYYAAPQTLIGACWPTTPDRVCVQDVRKWLAECAQPASNLITVYTHNGAEYLQLTDFKQNIRTKSKFPEHASILRADCAQNASTSRSSDFVVRSSYFANSSSSACAKPDPRQAAEPAAQPQQQPVPDPQQEIWELCAELCKLWPNPGNEPRARSAAEHVFGHLQVPLGDWLATIRRRAPLSAEWHSSQRASNPRHFIPSLERWFADGDWGRDPPSQISTKPVGVMEKLKAAAIARDAEKARRKAG